MYYIRNENTFKKLQSLFCVLFFEHQIAVFFFFFLDDHSLVILRSAKRLCPKTMLILSVIAHRDSWGHIGKRTKYSWSTRQKLDE